MIKALQGQNFMAVVSSPGVLETSDQGDREAFQKAKILYKSCMNESECLLVPSIPLIDSKPNIQKNQSPVQQNPINIWLIHGAMPGKFIFKWMKMPWCSMKPQYIHLGCGKEVWWVPTLVWMQSFSFTRHKPVPAHLSQTNPVQISTGATEVYSFLFWRLIQNGFMIPLILLSHIQLQI